MPLSSALAQRIRHIFVTPHARRIEQHELGRELCQRARRPALGRLDDDLRGEFLAALAAARASPRAPPRARSARKSGRVEADAAIQLDGRGAAAARSSTRRPALPERAIRLEKRALPISSRAPPRPLTLRRRRSRLPLRPRAAPRAPLQLRLRRRGRARRSARCPPSRASRAHGIRPDRPPDASARAPGSRARAAKARLRSRAGRAVRDALERRARDRDPRAHCSDSSRCSHVQPPQRP